MGLSCINDISTWPDARHSPTDRQTAPGLSVRRRPFSAHQPSQTQPAAASRRNSFPRRSDDICSEVLHYLERRRRRDIMSRRKRSCVLSPQSFTEAMHNWPSGACHSISQTACHMLNELYADEPSAHAHQCCTHVHVHVCSCMGSGSPLPPNVFFMKHTYYLPITWQCRNHVFWKYN